MTTLVRPRRSVWLAGNDAKAPKQVGDHNDADVEGEAHVEAGQDVGRHPGLGVIDVVEDDRGQNGQCQVAHPAPTPRYSSMVWSKRKRPSGLRTAG